MTEGGPIVVEKVVYTRRISKVVKGGRHLRFNALVVIGDGEGMVGAGLGKANAIPDAVRKGSATARKESMQVPLKGSTIPHETSAVFGASLVLIKPAPPGTGLIASGAMKLPRRQSLHQDGAVLHLNIHFGMQWLHQGTLGTLNGDLRVFQVYLNPRWHGYRFPTYPGKGLFRCLD